MCEVTEGDGYPISIRGLRKEYRSRSGTAVAVAGLDLDVPVGGVFGFLGPNVVPGIDFRVAIHSRREITPDQFKRAVSEVTAERVVAHLNLRQAPLEDPTKAIEIFPDVKEATLRATHAEDASYEMGDVIATWRDDA